MNVQDIESGTWTELIRDFPGLAGHENECKELKNDVSLLEYNCIAWSLNITWSLVQPPPNRNDFIALYEAFGFRTCNAAESTVDGYASDNVMTHASRRLHLGWSSKLGTTELILHPRHGLTGTPDPMRGAPYGDVNIHLHKPENTIPGAAEDGGTRGPEPLSEKKFAAILALNQTIQQYFGTLSDSFKKDFPDWRSICPHVMRVSSIHAVTRGPEYDRLVAMGVKILPLLVAELRSDFNAIACELYNNLQTDVTKKVSQTNIEQYCVLNWQARHIVSLYYSQIEAFDGHAQDWVNHLYQIRRSSNPDVFCSGPAYTALKAMGPAIVPLVMVRYVHDKDGWWHELLFEILNGHSSGATFVNKKELWAKWSEWYDAPDTDPSSAQIVGSSSLEGMDLGSGVVRSEWAPRRVV